MLGPASRREWLWNVGGGLGGIALAQMLGQGELLAGTGPDRPRADLNGGLHHPAKVRRIVQLFLNGGVSQMDTFDHKPELTSRHGEVFDPGEKVEAVTSTPGSLMKSPFEFRQHGESGRWVSSVLPHLAGCVDNMAFLMALTSRTNVHGPASYLMNTGFLTPGFPCLGAWVSYGLGALGDNLPTFVVLPDPKGLPYNAKGNFTAGFLPMTHQGTIIDAGAPEPILDLFPDPSSKFLTPEAEREGLKKLAAMNRRFADRNQGDSRLDSRIKSYELAARMQLGAPRRSTSPASPRPLESCTASKSRRLPTLVDDASWPAAFLSGAYASSRSGVGPAVPATIGTTTPTSPRSCRPSPDQSTSQPPRS